MVRNTFFCDTPDITKEIRPFVAAGATVNLIADFAPTLVLTEPGVTIEASAEIYRPIKKPGALQ